MIFIRDLFGALETQGFLGIENCLLSSVANALFLLKRETERENGDALRERRGGEVWGEGWGGGGEKTEARESNK